MISIRNLQSSSILAVCISTISLSALPKSAHAISLIGNTTGAANILPLESNVIDTDRFLAVQFTTPVAPAGFLLNSVRLKVSGYRTNGVAASGNLDRILASITDNTNGNAAPGSDVFVGFNTDAASVPSSSNALRTLTLLTNSSFIFAPSTTYWLQIAAFDATTIFNWTSNDDSTTGSNESISPSGLAILGPGGYRYTTDGGATFTSTTALSTFDIDVTPVPFEFEASGGIAILGGLFLANKLRKRKQTEKSDEQA